MDALTEKARVLFAHSLCGHSKTKTIWHVHVEFYSIESFQGTIYVLKINAKTFKEVNVTCRISFVRQYMTKRSCIYQNKKNSVADPDLELREGPGFFECVKPKKILASIFTRIYT